MKAWESNIRKVEPYVPGEQPKVQDVIKLNTNENPYGPSENVRKAMEAIDIDRCRLYPDPDVTKLVKSIADYYGMDNNQVFVGVGSDDVLSMCFLTFFNGKKPVLFPDITYSFYDVCNKQNSVRRLDIENNMRQAVATGIDEFVVFYQPVVDINTEECASCEALVRWDSKSLGFMGPGDFIPLAEYLGLITSIGDYVLEEACRQCRYWNEHGMPDFHINVNLSVVQLLQKDIVDTVAKVLKKTGVNPRNIVLEITESFAINDMDRVLNIINGIRELGPKIALDDFGTGYSSLNYIKQLPFDIIKVDKTFIDDITEDEYAQAFIKLIVELSATIGTKIVVEGVEDKSQLDILRELGVDFIQGYYYGKPEPAYEFERLNFKGRINI